MKRHKYGILRLLMVLLAALVAGCGNEGGATGDGNTTTVEGGHKNHNSNDHSEDHGGHGEHEESSSELGPLEVSWSYDGENISPEQELEMKVHIAIADGTAVGKFTVNHEKLLHLIIVSEDLSYFRHLHPEYTGEGNFVITTSFPEAGRYKLISDFIPEKSHEVTAMEWVEVGEGEHEHHLQGLQPDVDLYQVVEGKAVGLQFDSLIAGENTTLSFTVADADTKEPIEDLEPYLGAVGHVVILSEDIEEYLHVHPLDEGDTGPEAQFMTTFPEPGLYKIWGQFRHEGKVFTVPYVVEVP